MTINIHLKSDITEVNQSNLTFSYLTIAQYLSGYVAVKAARYEQGQQVQEVEGQNVAIKIRRLPHLTLPGLT